MKLFLTSAGFSTAKLKRTFLKLLSKKPRDIKLAYIPTAFYPKPDERLVTEAIQELNSLGIKDINVIDLKLETQGSLDIKLNEIDVIYVDGGNSFNLMDWVRRSEFDKALSQFLQRGGIYVGVSAGSVICGPDISVSGWDPGWDENINNLKDLSGLGLTRYVISPHYIKEDNYVLKTNSRLIDYPIIALNDEQAFLVIDSQTRIIGRGGKIIFGRL